MARWGKVDSRELKKLQKKIDRLYKVDFIKLQISILKELSGRHLRRLRRTTPYDTKALRRAWSVGKILHSGRTTGVKVFNNKSYGVYVEYGHRRNRKMMGKGPKWIEGKFFLKNAEDKLKKDGPKITRKIMNEALSEVLNGK